MEITIEQLIWDEWNRQHIKKHNLIPEEVELALIDNFCISLPGHSNRWRILGRSGKRLITTVVQKKSGNKYYVVTARDMSKKERAQYRDERKKNEN